jgi:hypothetical protein
VFPQVESYSYDKYGYDSYGYDKSGYDKYGYGKEGYHKDGYDRWATATATVAATAAAVATALASSPSTPLRRSLKPTSAPSTYIYSAVLQVSASGPNAMPSTREHHMPA